MKLCYYVCVVFVFSCWLSFEYGASWAFVGPVLFVTSVRISFTFFVCQSCVIFNALSVKDIDMLTEKKNVSFITFSDDSETKIVKYL